MHSTLTAGRPRAVAYPFTGVSRRPSLRCCATSSGSSSDPIQRPPYVPNRIDDPNYVRIFDTTLRDGEQSPGATLTSKEKLQIAKQLNKLGVDVIEAGFPIASPDDFAGVQAIAQEVGNAVDEDGYVPAICAFARTCDDDIYRAWESVKDARFPRVNTFIATSKIHMEHKLRMTPDQVILNAVHAIRHLRQLGCTDIEFTPEDATRSDPAFLCEVLGEVIKAGATTINVTDTTGWGLPHEFRELIATVKKNTPGAENVIISAHCHNDLGQAASNTLMAALGGARQLECTINGIGERAGNASFEEVIMALALKGQKMGGLRTGIRPIHIAPTSKMVAEFSGMFLQPHKAIVGTNAFAHESGIHQDGMLKNRETYEIMSPEAIGLVRGDDAGLVLGKHSGRKALATKLKQMGFELPAEQLNDLFKRFKVMADKKKNITDEDVLALVSDEMHQPPAIMVLNNLQAVCGSLGTATATVVMTGPDGVVHTAGALGTGPVDAAFKAIDSLVKVQCTLLDYSVSSVTEGIDALVWTRVIIRPSGKDAGEGLVTGVKGDIIGRTFTGSGADEDIVVSSARAYVSALNKMIPYLSMRTQFDALKQEMESTSSSQSSSALAGAAAAAAAAETPVAPAPATPVAAEASESQPASSNGKPAPAGRQKGQRRQLVARAQSE